MHCERGCPSAPVKGGINLLALELQTAVRCQVMVLGTKSDPVQEQYLNHISRPQITDCLF